MNKNDSLKLLGAVSLMMLALSTLWWALNRTDVEPLVLSKATLKGKVTYRGKPVSSAMVIVATESGNTVAGTGLSDAAGNFLVQFAPVGKVKIGVDTEAGKAMMRGATMAAVMTRNKSAIPPTSDVPRKFFSPETSGITTVLSNADAENQFDIELK